MAIDYIVVCLSGLCVSLPHYLLPLQFSIILPTLKGMDGIAGLRYQLCKVIQLVKPILLGVRVGLE